MVARLKVQARSREERARTRAVLGTLREARIGKTTYQRYLWASQRFCHWLAATGWGFALDWDGLEKALIGYLECLWEEGETRGLAGDTLSSVQHFLDTRRRFQGAWRLLSTWGRLELPNRAAPLTPLMVSAMAGLLVSVGEPVAAGVLLTAFHLCLRTAEALSLHGAHILVRRDYTGVVSLPWTKTSQQRGAREEISVDDPYVGFWLAAALRLSNGALLTASGPAHFRRLFAFALAELRLQHLNLRPYSLRRGGATHDFLEHRNPQRTQMRGRWSDLRTMKIYVQDGAAIIAETKLPSDTVRLLLHFQDVLFHSARCL